MRLSAFFLPTLKDTPAEAQLVSHRLMLRAGMIRQVSAGIYSWLPLGLRVLRRIETIVRQEQDRCGALEMLMPTIQPADLWKESGRYDAYGDEMLRISDRHGRQMLYGPTNEELITEAFRAHVRSYRQLPLMLYHIQWKFRDEVRPRFGVMRGREFLMKDAYSFDETDQAGQKSYHRMYVAYLNTFARLGLKAVPMRAETGPIGGDLSHEFAILADNGESVVHCDADLVDMPAPGPDVDFAGDLRPYVEMRSRLYSAADDMHDEVEFKKKVPVGRRVSAQGIEVGHIFHFGAKYSEPMKAMIADRLGTSVPVRMGSYGIGISRLVGAIIEASHDDAGIVWPTACAPFGVGVVNLRQGDQSVDALCERAHQRLAEAQVEPLYDDSDDRAGVKLSRMELIGLPYALVVGPRSAAEGEVELRRRGRDDIQVMPPDAAVETIIQDLSS